MTLPGRTSTGNDYRYGFQGQEKDDELKGEGNSLNYTFRMHDPRVGRFFAVDPLEKDYPFYSPYHFSSNQPIHAHELEGKESFNDLSFNTDPALTKFRSSMTKEERKSSSDAFNEGFLLTTFAGGAVVSTGMLVLPELSAAYGSYSSWFGTTQLSNSLSSGTGSMLFSEIESMFTLKGLIVSRTTIGLGAMNATNNIIGQYWSNNRVFDEKINWAQPLAAFLIANPFYSNAGESLFHINYDENYEYNINYGYNDVNSAVSTFTSNYIGGKINNRIAMGDLGYKPVENVFNTIIGSSVEVFENFIGEGINNTLNKINPSGTSNSSSSSSSQIFDTKIPGFSSSNNTFGSPGKYKFGG